MLDVVNLLIYTLSASTTWKLEIRGMDRDRQWMTMVYFLHF